MSLDGYIEDASGSIGFTHPEPDVHAYINNLETRIDTHIYGRRLYETMNGFWPTAGDDPDAEPEIVDYARIWNALDKLVFSRTLKSAGPRARLATADIATELAQLKAKPGKDISVGGAELATQFIAQDLVDQYWVIIYPVLIGGGKPMFGELDRHLNLELFESRIFPSGVSVLLYRRPGR
jgi:dihydrofolate reductase